MSTVWPGAFDSLSVSHVNNVGEPVNANDINNMAAAIEALEQTLGIHPELGSLPAGSFSTVVARLNAIDNPAIHFVNDASSYSLLLQDMFQILNMWSLTLSTMTIAIPPHSSVPFPIGASIPIRMAGTAVINFSPGTGVTLKSRGGATQLAGQYAWASLIQVDVLDHWDLVGDIA